MSYQEKIAAGGQALILGVAALFVFLVLAAQYDNWTSPAAVIAMVPLAALGAVLALWARGANNNTYTQIGIMLLIALTSKNAILMTAFSSILGFLPAVSLDRRSQGSRGGLPRTTNVIDAELIGVTWPMRSRLETSRWQCTRSRRIATELMIQRIHQVLANAPRERLTHVRGRRNHQCGRLSVRQIVVISVPSTLSCHLIGPQLRCRIGVRRLRRRSSGEGRQGNDRQNRKNVAFHR